MFAVAPPILLYVLGRHAVDENNDRITRHVVVCVVVCVFMYVCCFALILVTTFVCCNGSIVDERVDHTRWVDASDEKQLLELNGLHMEQKIREP